MAVEELAKPGGSWCPHCDKSSGCTVYAERPQSCRDFECVWLQSQSKPDPMPADARPDRCKVVLDVAQHGKALIAHVDRDYPDAWRRGAIGRILSGFTAKRGSLIVACGDHRHAFFPGRPPSSFKATIGESVKVAGMTIIERAP
jgi:hypothetical protein